MWQIRDTHTQSASRCKNNPLLLHEVAENNPPAIVMGVGDYHRWISEHILWYGGRRQVVIIGACWSHARVMCAPQRSTILEVCSWWHRAASR